MNKREKIIATIAVIMGATAGTAIGYWISRFDWSYLVVLFFALVGFMTLASMTLSVLIDVRREDRSYPVPDTFDTSYEE